ncbi:chemotaxis protein CheA [Intestinibacillus sp. NTUH-41-i26]|uniref:chemotaxis protein CheA n=1 Tax=Butyricicoccaceae TaxID=3085642 RepID=UPI000D1EE2FC|nr:MULTISPECIES: chemotaxis protein CheA [Butyricicoccaceae]MBS6882547.1 chemotaxis protein CheA [Clostridiaceae bacterium]WOC74497.1 chemotaxis protein CheA [Intestinibacillus sp. NTUH-41-i26]
MANSGDSVLEMYLYETNTLLEQLDNIMLAAEQADTLSQDDVNEIFRIMHTLKGSAAMMEYEPLMTIAHRIEDLFYLIRENTMDIVPEQDRPKLFDLLFRSIDYFRDEIGKIEKGEPLSTNIDRFVETINMFIDKIKNDGQVAGSSGEAPSADQAAAQGCRTATVENAPAGYPFALRVFLDEGCGMENLRAFMIVSDVRDSGTQFLYQPEDLESNTARSPEIAENGFTMYFAAENERKAAIPLISDLGFVKTYQEIDAAPAPEAQRDEKQEPAPEATGQTEPQKAAPAAGAEATSGKGSGHQIKQSLISVNLSKLDQLMAVVGEIVITETMVTASPDLRGIEDAKLDNFYKSARQLRKLTDELQDISMSLRMVPVSGTFQKMRRIVRDMGQKLGRKAQLSIIGEDTEIDKTIVDAISDPIMHIVRNSMDHGIEPDEQMRIDAGKNPVGEITLSAQNTGSEVIIKIEDDGMGVDCDAVLRKALRQGLASPDVEYSQREIMNFLMMPGFSTNQEVTEFSGRGVGMDVVKKNVETVGGVVTMTSEKGKGSCTTLKIPLTTAIMDGMEVRVGESIFTIPIQNIRQSFKVTEKDIIHDAMQGEIINKMEEFYPVVRLYNVYGIEPQSTSINDGILVWVESSESSCCLFVDELLGKQQVVIKPLPSYLNNFKIKDAGIAGCTILGDGNISLILDVTNLMDFISGSAGY